jgi:hypothetical protein
MAGKPEGYIEVKDRLIKFYERFPEGSLKASCTPFVVDVAGKQFVWYGALAYRTPDDPIPGEGWAAEPIPGATNFTRNSELMNAETSAWGRALAAVGIEVKEGIASANEVRARQDVQRAEASTPAAPVASVPAQAGATASPFNPPPSVAAPATPKQKQTIKELLPKVAEATGDSLAQIKVDVRKLAGCNFADMSEAVAEKIIPKLEGWIDNSPAQEQLGGGVK